MFSKFIARMSSYIIPTKSEYTHNWKVKVRLLSGSLDKMETDDRVLLEDEVCIARETGQFKVGDGKSAIKDLPWATTLPLKITAVL